MSDVNQAVREVYGEMERLRRICADAADGFEDLHGHRIEQYRAAVRAGVRDFIAKLQEDLRSASGNNRTCAEFGARISDYLEWLQWSFWDLPYFALPMGISDERLREAVRTCGMAYLSLRILDDVVDRHYVYKGRHATLMELFEEGPPGPQKAEGCTVLAGLLVCFSGLAQLAASSRPMAHLALERALDSLGKTTIGALMEMSPREQWTEAYYERMTRLKNVEFWKILYSGLDPECASPLYPFLDRYYWLAQKLNDIQDFTEDEKRGQPNLVSMSLPGPGSENGNRAPQRTAPVPVELQIAEEFLDLAKLAGDLPSEEHIRVARLKLGHSLDEAFRAGLFRNGATASAAGPAPQSALGLDWYCTLEEIVALRGVGVLSEANCAVCKSGARRRLFEKQGFSYYRCAGCEHVYVSPRVGSEVVSQMSAELDTRDRASGLMSIQKLFARPICHLLRSRAPGPRLLDIGFGQGWILQLAKSHGFEPYGLESSLSQIEHLQSQLGNHLHLVKPGEADFPWQGFDAIVISHVLEHLPEPAEFLQRVFQAMNPDGVLYVAVPDIDSFQFQAFGKRWDVVSPITHLQYFRESTLRHVLSDCLFRDIERVNHAPLADDVAPRWMRLMRKLGGTDAGELAMICRRPAL